FRLTVQSRPVLEPVQQFVRIVVGKRQAVSCMVIFVIRYDGVFQSSCLSYDWCTQITDRNQLAESARFKKTRHDEEITRSIDPSGEWVTDADCDVDVPGEMLFKRPEIPLIFSVTGPKND